MRAVIQRVKNANVQVDKKVVGKIDQGILVLFGCHKDDTENKIDYLVDKITNMRIFSDENDKMNLSLKDINGDILIVSQFTLLADTKKGRRPSFINSMQPMEAEKFYEKFILKMKQHIKNVETGIFGAKMQISLINDGPVTFVLDI
ncbi:MAG: D-aminoacyl-tRNA deacylase [Candidatus Anoxychlamydiales bacterium]|nr:D-aminoacyl-tRNA deacylase [Candidatus Anoxychlamydiales bacterium]